MARTRVVALLSLVGVAIFPASALPSCESAIETKSRYLSFMAYEIYPIAITDDSVGQRSMEIEVSKLWARLARGLATAANCERRIEADSLLSKVFADAPLSLKSSFGGPVQAGELSPHEVTPSDSIVALFRDLDRDSSAELFTLLLGSFGRKSAAESFMMKLGYSPEDDDEDSEGEFDTTVAMDIVYSDCMRGFDRATLFMLPAEQTNNRKVWVLSGLFYARADAQRALGRHRIPGKGKGRVIQLRFTGPVLRSAISRL